MSFIGLVLLLPMSSGVQARAAMVGLGSTVSAIGLVRPAGAWDVGRIRSWRRVLGDRTMVAFYILLGCAVIAIGLVAPYGSGAVGPGPHP